jgi:hypothetical protein
MTTMRCFVLAGGVFLLVGLHMALISNHYSAKVMGKAALGLAVVAPNPGSPAMKRKERLRARADRSFWIGVALTAMGVVLQTAAVFVSPE